jgi:Ser-tRNA(Ala) deacylase AlaX
MASLVTEPLYQKDGHIYTHTTTISNLTPVTSAPPDTQKLFKIPEGTPYLLTTPSTIFHAQGGGQPTDTGTMTCTSKQGPKFIVHQVRKVDPTILHLGVFEPADDKFEGKGEEIVQDVDVEKRILHSRYHTAGHVIGLAINLLSKSNDLIPSDIKDGKASHYPSAAFVECHGLIPGTAKQAIQDKVDELVARDLAVSIYFWTEEEASRKCIGGTDGAAISGDDVRVVDLGGLGSYPCGGTHVKTLKELGKVVVRGIKRQKGVSKVSYEVADA